MQVNPTILFILFLVVAGYFSSPVRAQDNPVGNQDAVAADPEHHRVLFEDENIRILEVNIPPGNTENLHIHPWSSVVIYDRQQPDFNHIFADGTIRAYDRTATDGDYPIVFRLGPDGQMQGVENIDTIPRYLYRIEFKNLDFATRFPQE